MANFSRVSESKCWVVRKAQEHVGRGQSACDKWFRAKWHSALWPDLDGRFPTHKQETAKRPHTFPRELLLEGAELRSSSGWGRLQPNGVFIQLHSTCLSHIVAWTPLLPSSQLVFFFYDTENDKASIRGLRTKAKFEVWEFSRTCSLS